MRAGLSPAQRLVAAACGVSYASLVVTTFKLLEEPREALQDWAAGNLPELPAKKVQELLDCNFCISFWAALIVSRGRPIRALQLAGMASVPSALVLLAVSK